MISEALTLKNETVIKNRLAKSALSEQLSDRDHNPTDELICISVGLRVVQDY